MWWKVLLGIVAVWVVFGVLGAIFGAVLKGLFWLVVLLGFATGVYVLVKAFSKSGDDRSSTY